MLHNNVTILIHMSTGKVTSVTQNQKCSVLSVQSKFSSPEASEFVLPQSMSLSGMVHIFFILLTSLLFNSCRSAVQEEADEIFADAESALQAGDWQSADESFYEATLLHPERAEAWVGRGMALTKLGEIAIARAHYEEALSLCRKPRDPDDPAPPEETVRKEIMVLVLLVREEEAQEVAIRFSGQRSEPEILNELLSLIDELRTGFAEMILPPESESHPFFEEKRDD